VLILLAFLTACTKPESLDTSSIILPPPSPEPIVTRSVEFKVINAQTLESIDTQSTSWYALNSKNYENLAYNMQEILRYLKQQQAVIEYYETTTNTSNTD
jgi:hypothetical protein